MATLPLSAMFGFVNYRGHKMNEEGRKGLTNTKKMILVCSSELL